MPMCFTSTICLEFSMVEKQNGRRPQSPFKNLWVQPTSWNPFPEISFMLNTDPLVSVASTVHLLLYNWMTVNSPLGILFLKSRSCWTRIRWSRWPARRTCSEVRWWTCAGPGLPWGSPGRPSWLCRRRGHRNLENGRINKTIWVWCEFQSSSD